MVPLNKGNEAKMNIHTKSLINIPKNSDSVKSFKVITAALSSFGRLLAIIVKSIKTPYYILLQVY